MAPNDSGSITEQLATRVRELLQGAEEQATKVMEDAEAEVKRIRGAAAEQGHKLIEEARSALDDLEGRLEPGRPPASPEPPKPPAAAPPPPKPEKAPEPEPEESPAKPLPVPEAAVADPGPPPSKAAGGDEAAARLVAMKLALDGTSRDDVRAKIETDYSVADLDGVLDDVFAKAGR